MKADSLLGFAFLSILSPRLPHHPRLPQLLTALGFLTTLGEGACVDADVAIMRLKLDKHLGVYQVEAAVP